MSKTAFDKKMIKWLAAGLLFVATFVLTLMIFYSSGDALTLRPDDPATVKLGKTLYLANCASCHGEKLQGQENWKSRNENGRMPAPPHDKSGHTWHHADALLFELTKFGLTKIAGPGYESDMPAFDGVLSDREIVAVLSFIKSSWPKKIRQRNDKINKAYVKR